MTTEPTQRLRIVGFGIKGASQFTLEGLEAVRSSRRVLHLAGEPGELAHTYRLGGPTCMAGDVIGEYSFAEPLRVGSKIVIEDMAPYTMVKNTMFNGVRLPGIAVRDAASGAVRLIREFHYEDYRSRLS